MKNLKSILLKALLSVIALMSMLTLCFALLKIEMGKTVYKENGFTFLSFYGKLMSKSYQWGAITMGVCTIIEMIVSLVAIVLALLNFINKENRKGKGIAIIVLSLTIAVLYLIEGIVYKSIFMDTMGYFLDYDSDVKTSSFIPLIIISIFVSGYFLVNGLMPAQLKIEKKEKKEKPIKVTPVREKDSLELLEKYKKLLDDGVITQEEFDVKKKQYLNL